MLYHVNPSTGDAGSCSAVKGNCPFGKTEEHYDSLESAREAYEAKQTGAEPFKKRVTTTSGEAGAHNLYRGLPVGVPPKEGEHCDLNYFSERDADAILDTWERPHRTNEVEYPLAEVVAINFYQGTGYKKISEALRGEGTLTFMEHKHLMSLKNALKKARLKQPLTLFRGISGDYAERLSSMKPGEVIQDEGFLSTTPSEKGALTFAKPGGVMLQIEADAGEPAIDLGAGLYSLDEDEILLRPKMLKVTQVRRETLDGKPVTRITAVAAR